MNSPSDANSPQQPHLQRSFGVLRATALNMANVVGVGPFITIPLILSAMGGPQALLGWMVGALLATCDGMVWAELGAAWPGSGGSYRFLREAYGRDSLGRMMAFLFIWQFIFSGPLEIASGMIGFSQYAGYLLPGMSPLEHKLLAAGVGVVALALLYRKINFVGRLTVALWVGTLATMVAVILAGVPRFSATLAFSFPPGAFSFSRGFFLGLGSAMLIAMYDYMGYYDVCYIGDEVRDPARTIPRSILYCIVLTAIGYLGVETVIIGGMPWQQAARSQFVVSEFVQLLHGRGAAIVITAMILWTAFASVFALLLGYSRIPYAAARDGYFFSAFARVHPRLQFPHVSLTVLCAVAIGACFFSLDVVITAMMTTRILVQFIAQIFALPRLRRALPPEQRPYKMWLYPVPATIAFLGWAYIFMTSGWQYITGGLVTLAAGIAVYMWRAKTTRTWPFATSFAANSRG